jgi:BASS family bile acid:Na+ symporter
MKMRTLRQFFLVISALGLLTLLVGLAMREPELIKPAAVTTAAAFATGLGAIPSLRTYQFTAWIVAGAASAMLYPDRFLQLGPVDLRDKTLILVVMQLVMFGMGTQMRIRDLAGVARTPYPVFIGIALQFTVMPLIGYALATTLGFSPEVGAGIVLIGSCSSGLASNVMTFIAKANLPLSITLTSLATMLAPIMTPLWMKFLAGRMIPIDAVAMMMEIVKLIMVPIGAAMLDDYLENASLRGRRIILASAAIAVIALAAALFGDWTYFTTRLGNSTLNAMRVAGFAMAALIAGLAYHGIKKIWPTIATVMPAVSMIGIVYVTSVTVAAGRERLLVIGPMLLVAVITHNSLGYLLGYWLSRAFRLDEKSARTVAIEVGLQNGGMASTIAAAMNQLATLGLAAAVFNPWMNFSGSILANYWRRRPPREDQSPGGIASGSLPN